MRSETVYWEAQKNPIKPSPGFVKKGLSDYHLELSAKCQYECTYCSSNLGTYLRMNWNRIKETTGQQLGHVMLPGRNIGFNIQYTNLIPNLRRQAETEGESFGEGKTLVFSMLTDAFSPYLLQQRITNDALEILLDRTSFRIRVLTKNAAVGSPQWVDFFKSYKDRFVVGLSVGTLDNEWARKVEIGTSPPTKRTEALRRLQDAGVPTFGMLCPVFPTNYARLPKLKELVDSIRPHYSEEVWAEPYNDRVNWKHVRDGFEEGSSDWETINEMFSSSNKRQNVNCRETWSKYATNLLLDVRDIARKEDWIGRLNFLLYEHDVTENDAERIEDLEGVMLQSVDKDDRSKKPYFAKMQNL